MAIHEVEEASLFHEVQFQNKVFKGETNLPPKKKRFSYTLPKTDISPEKCWLEDYFGTTWKGSMASHSH